MTAVTTNQHGIGRFPFVAFTCRMDHLVDSLQSVLPTLADPLSILYSLSGLAYLTLILYDGVVGDKSFHLS